MKKSILILSFCFSFLACNTQNDTGNKSSVSEEKMPEDGGETDAGETKETAFQKAWETDTIFNTPESVLAYNGVLYVSSVGGKNPLAKDGNGFISKLNTSGEVLSLHWAEDLDAPKGMAILGGKLYVTDIDRLVEIDLESGKQLNEFVIENAIFLNDVSSTSTAVYFSDMKTGKIHELKNGEVATFAENLASINGLYAEQDKLLCLTGAGFQWVDYLTQEVSTITDEIKGGDGIERTSNGAYVASKWKGQVYLVSGSKAELLLDTEKEGTQTADIGYLAKENLVLIPTFFGNRVVAYKLN